MNELFELFYRQLKRISVNFVRYLYRDIRWDNRLIAITGARGVGKTTLMLQYAKLNFRPGHEVLYVSLDHIWFLTHSLVELADDFVKRGGKVLLLDEVHKYPTWSQEIKNIYDGYPDLQIVFTGSSMLEIHRSGADLSRRSVVYHLQGLSFREFLAFEHGIKMEPVAFEDVLRGHVDLALEVGRQVKPLVVFNEYVRWGYFPFYKEDRAGYYERLVATLNTVLEVDLPASQRIDYYSIQKIRKLFAILAQLVPYTQNVSQLSKEVGVTRATLLNFLYYLGKAQAILLLEKDATGLKQLAKPEKVYLGNTNYAYGLGGERTDIGNVRETFFLSHLLVRNRVAYSNVVDFVVDEKYHMEIGGRNKTRKQLAGVAEGYVGMDDIEVGNGNVIPLWLFGLLY